MDADEPNDSVAARRHRRGTGRRAIHWLPDAELDPHPRWTWFATCCFDLGLAAVYRIQAIYPPGYRLRPGTLVISNHLRDADAPIIASALCQRKWLRVAWPLPFFASREDLFWPDFLSTYLQAWPRLLRWAIAKIPVAGLLRSMRVEPMRRVPEYTLDEAFAELPPTDNNSHWLNTRGRRETAAIRVSNFGSEGKPWRRHDWGLRRLHRQARQVLEPKFRAAVSAQLERFAGLLDAGRVVYLAPEGTASRSGRFGRIRGGAWAITQHTETPPAIQPVALSYDALRAGRLRAVVHIGAPLESFVASRRRDFDAKLETRLRHLYPLTASHLTSRFLVAGAPTFTTDEFAGWLDYARGQLAEAGATLDPRLARGQTRTLARKRLRWLRRKGLVARTRQGWANRWPNDAEPGWAGPASIVRYCDNALDDHIQAVAPGMSLRP